MTEALLVLGGFAGGVAATLLMLRKWVRDRRAEQLARDREQVEREVRLNIAEQEARKAADDLRPYSEPSNR